MLSQHMLHLIKGTSTASAGMHRQNSYLRRVDDGTESVHIEHAEVGDGEGPARELVRLQLVRSRLASQLPDLSHKTLLNSHT